MGITRPRPDGGVINRVNKKRYSVQSRIKDLNYRYHCQFTISNLMGFPSRYINIPEVGKAQHNISGIY